MIDPAARLLLEPLAQTSGQCLWFADENSLGALAHLQPYAQKLTLLSHRCDIVAAATALGINSILGDSLWPAGQFNGCFFRLAKEKPLVHHILNQARQHLPAGAKLWLTGSKNEGVKTYADKAATLFGATHKAQKHGEVYLTQLVQPAGPAEPEFLDTQNYTKLRPVLELEGRPIYSRPGIYGWDKIDAGSRFLIATVKTLLDPATPIGSCLDLGCGYGYLTLAMADFTIGRRVATDNNINAVAAMGVNADRWPLDVTSITANCAQSIAETFDLILCNPPFHKGFDIHTDLTDAFLLSAKTHLTAKGQAFFVVNSFIAVEKKAGKYFRHTRTLADNQQFKVVQCWQ